MLQFVLGNSKVKYQLPVRKRKRKKKNPTSLMSNYRLHKVALQISESYVVVIAMNCQIAQHNILSTNLALSLFYEYE